MLLKVTSALLPYRPCRAVISSGYRVCQTILSILEPYQTERRSCEHDEAVYVVYEREETPPLPALQEAWAPEKYILRIRAA